MNQLIKNNFLFSILFTAFLAPIIFFTMGLPMILQLKGFDAALIGFFQILGIPTVLKFLLSTPIDKIKFKKNHYKKWVFYIGIIYVLSLIFISFLSLEDSNIYLIFICLLISTIISTFIDIPLNALAIKVFTKEQRISAGSYKISAFFLAGLLGGGVFLLIYNNLDWKISFLIMACLVLFSLLALYFIEENNEIIEKKNNISFLTIFSFFKQKNISIWIFILMFYFAFISAVWVFMKPYFISKGINANDVTIYVGIYGSILGFLGGILASFIAKRFNKKTILVLFSLFNIITILILLFIENFSISIFSMLICVSFTAIAIALSSAIIFSMIMDYSRSSSKGIDYALQSSLFALTRIISAIIAGIIVSNFGFEKMFIFELSCIVVVTFVIYKKYNTNYQNNS